MILIRVLLKMCLEIHTHLWRRLGKPKNKGLIDLVGYLLTKNMENEGFSY